MIQQTPQLDNFKRQLRDSLQQETANSRAVRIARHANVYNSGDQDEMVPKERSAFWRSIAMEIFSVSCVSVA